MLEPLATPASMDFTPVHIVAIVLVASMIGLIGVGIRHFLLASGYELGAMARGLASRMTGRAVERRKMPATPWLCAV